MNLIARMKEIDARLSEIRKMSNDESDVEKLTNYEKECDSLQEERKSIQAKLSIMPQNTRYKLSQTVTKIVNKGANNLIAIVI